MRKFKLYDTWINISLITGFAIISLVKLDSTFLIGYCVVGGWQVVSMLMHAANGWFDVKGSGRNIYQATVAVIICLALIGLLLYPVLYLVLMILLFAAPFMAVFYTMICYNEVYVKMQRPISLLK